MAASPFAIVTFILLLGLPASSFAEWRFSASTTDHDHNISNRETQLHVEVQPKASESEYWGARHNYRVFDLPDVNRTPAASNGHVHALSGFWRHRFDRWQVELAPTLAVSSNVLRNPDTLSASDWHLHGSAIRRFDLRDQGEFYGGLRIDNRLGDYLPYPMVQWQRQLPADIRLALGVPDSAVDWYWHPRLRWRLSLGPDGGSWRVRDSQIDSAGRLEQRRWHTSLALAWHAQSPLTIQLGASYYFQERWRYQLSDGSTTRLEQPNHTALWVGLSIQP
ncbi:MAG: hypothetical protein R3276_02535 [Marinobacter sp.]|nr:hypothetical protein [Marinobacter sp.]